MATQNYNLTIDPNGGVWRAGFPSSEARPTGTEVCIRPGTIAIGSTAWNSITKPTRTGYWFAGWWTSETDGIMVYDANSECVESEYWTDSYANGGTYRHSGDMVLYARWYSPYTISFNLGGAGTRPNVTSPCGSWVEIASPEFDGHVFDGWMVTGHDKTTSEVSVGGAVSGMGSDPMIVHAGTGESISMRNLSNGGVAVLTAMWRTMFGGANAGCPTIEFPAFTPICSKGGIGASAPASFDVPAPVYAPIVPPPECVCLSFTDAENTPEIVVRVDKGNNTGNGTGTASVEIKSNGDCCDGGYTVKPVIDITIPECHHPDGILSTNEISLANGSTVTGGTIKYTLKMVGCAPRLSIETTPLQIVVPSGGASVCFAGSSFTLSGAYTLGTGDNASTYNAFDDQTVNLTPSIVPPGETNAGCWRYTMGNIALDLSSVAFGNGGSVFKDSSDGNLYTDGNTESGDTWFCGGLGDVASDAQEEYVPRRGPAMRGHESALAALGANTDHMVTFVQYAANSQQKMTTARGARTDTIWYSTRKSTGGELHGASGNLNVVLPTGFQWDEWGIALTLSSFTWNPSGILSSLQETRYAALLSPSPSLFDAGATINGISVEGHNASGLGIAPPAGAIYTPGLAVNAGDGLRVFGADDRSFSEVANGTTYKLGQLEVYAHDNDFAFTPNGRLVLNDTKTDPCADSEGILIPTVPEWVNGKLEPGSFGRDSDMIIRAVVCADDMMYWGQEVTETGFVSGNAYNSGRITMYNNYNKDWTLVSSVSSYLTGKGYPTTGNTVQESTPLSGTDSAKITSLQQLVTGLQDSVGRLGRALGHVVQSLASIGVVTLHVSRAGTIIHVDDNFCSDISRHVDSTD